MIDKEKRLLEQQKKENERKRMHQKIDYQNYEYIPAKKVIDYYDNDVVQRIAIYVRVSTDNIKQTTSYELQKKYYEDFVVHHPNWVLVKIYADEGISGTSTRHRDEFNNMIRDCRSGKIDMIICKNVSRFARNVADCIGIVRELASLKNPVGVFFESECIFSLKDDSQMALSFLATMAEEESHTRSRSMETSLRMRLDNGIPLTPKLLGYTHDANGELIINPEEAPTVKLVFYMYLYGYSTKQIAGALNALRRRSYLGNIKWTSAGIIQILRNERHCGDVYTRKTFTPNFRDHLSKKNRGERPRSRYYNHHEAIVSRDDFIAVQRMLDNAKYGNKSILPKLSVVTNGVFKGFVVINPRWAGFKQEDYIRACHSAYKREELCSKGDCLSVNENVEIEVSAGDFDMRGFEITRAEFFSTTQNPTVSFQDKKITFNSKCVNKFGKENYVELLINPIEKKFGVRSTDINNRNGVFISKLNDKKYKPKAISAAAFIETIYSIFEWNPNYKYKLIGSLYETENEHAFVFESGASEVYFSAENLPVSVIENSDLSNNKSIKAIPEEWVDSFGEDFYRHEYSLSVLTNQSEKDWQIRLKGELFDTGKQINVTPFEELKRYIEKEVENINFEEAN